jgi:hypothetical protein
MAPGISSLFVEDGALVNRYASATGLKNRDELFHTVLEGRYKRQVALTIDKGRGDTAFNRNRTFPHHQEK